MERRREERFLTLEQQEHALAALQRELAELNQQLYPEKPSPGKVFCDDCRFARYAPTISPIEMYVLSACVARPPRVEKREYPTHFVVARLWETARTKNALNDCRDFVRKNGFEKFLSWLFPWR